MGQDKSEGGKRVVLTNLLLIDTYTGIEGSVYAEGDGQTVTLVVTVGKSSVLPATLTIGFPWERIRAVMQDGDKGAGMKKYRIQSE
jgi:hypothetical protein